MIKQVTTWALAAGMVFGVAPSFAGDAAAGEQKAKAVCAACHGEGGGKPITPDYPILAGQHQDYLEHSLRAYKTGKRKNPIMTQQVAQLSKKDIADLAAYFAAQKSPLGTKYHH